MPFGLTNAPATFQRLMNTILKDYLDEVAAVYMDVILIYLRTFKEHIQHIHKILEKLKEVGLKIKLKKCRFCEQEVVYLGHVIGKDGIKPNKEKIEKIKNWKAPQNVSELRSTLGMFGYYRKFVEGYSKIAKPMNELLKKDNKYKWTETQQKAFETLKKKLMKEPIY